MTLVMEYQFWLYKIRMIFALKLSALKEVLKHLEMEECGDEKNGSICIVKILLLWQELSFYS